MRKAIRLMVLAASVFSVSVCAQTVPAPTAGASAVRPVFDCYHINYAWGFSLSGRFIDQDGTVYTYTKPKKAWMSRAIHEDGADYLHDADLQTKLTERTKAGSIDASILQQKMGLVDAAAKGKVVPLDGGARDAGSSSCHAYIYDANKARYRDINLGSDNGVNDVRLKNDSPQAQELLQWLATINAPH
jgi:hypothetical protein